MPKLFICVNDLSCVQYFVKLTLCCTYRFKKDGRRLFYSKVFFKTGFQYPQNVWSTNLYQKPGSCILLFSLLHWVHRSLKGHVCCSWCTQTLQRPAVQCKKMHLALWLFSLPFAFIYLYSSHKYEYLSV